MDEIITFRICEKSEVNIDFSRLFEERREEGEKIKMNKNSKTLAWSIMQNLVLFTTMKRAREIAHWV